jgi:hypothetical protein
MTMILDGSLGVTFNDASLQPAAASPYGLKNKIINGDMVIDQRNAGASGTGTNNYTVDRWTYYATQSSKLTWQQNAGSVTPPTGFTNYFGFTSSSAYSIASGDVFVFEQRIEGYNMSDLAWGTANAKTITISFWARSSLTGTFAGSIINSAFDRSYVFSYTISAANTWEYKTVTIAGCTDGTWLTTNGTGARVYFGISVGSTYTATAGSWLSSVDKYGVTGQTNIVGTNGATFYITGVQLERNTTATPFEWLPYSTELALCQRYYQPVLSATGSATSSTALNLSVSYTSMRITTPTFTTPSGYITITDWYATNTNTSSPPTWTINAQSVNNSNIRTTDISGLTTARPYGLSGGTGYIYAQAEL